VAAPEPALEPELTPEPEPTSQDSPAEGDVPAGDVLEAAGVQPQAAESEPVQAAAEASEAAEANPEDALREMRERIKQEQKKAAKPTIPAELLQDANSYEDKLMVVRMMVDQEHARVASVLKRMIKID